MFYVPIDALLADRGWSCYDLAVRVAPLGVSTQTVYRFCRVHGAPKRFDMRLLGALCEVFGLSPGELLKQGKPPTQRTKAKKPARKRRSR